ncbi:2'-5' RNA ligase family protein [Streptomyces sp. NPDC004539]|uniref:2'-5' RNA ligase family protein n=1 Tax=Streptomyces sp. NPDC004539 TaxID=3154280 RepID=UPI0033A55B80
MLAFPDDRLLAALAERCQEELALLGLDPVPLDGLHITLAREALLLAAFSVRAMPLTGSRGAVRLSLGPWEPLLRLHHALVETERAAGLAFEKPTSAFRSHLSLAYNNRRRPAAPVIPSVSRLRALPAVELAVPAVQLVELRREGRAYRREVRKNLPLG